MEEISEGFSVRESDSFSLYPLALSSSSSSMSPTSSSEYLTKEGAGLGGWRAPETMAKFWRLEDMVAVVAVLLREATDLRVLLPPFLERKQQKRHDLSLDAS